MESIAKQRVRSRLRGQETDRIMKEDDPMNEKEFRRYKASRTQA